MIVQFFQPRGTEKQIRLLLKPNNSFDYFIAVVLPNGSELRDLADLLSIENKNNLKHFYKFILKSIL
jgi:hypothetical protein